MTPKPKGKGWHGDTPGHKAAARRNELKGTSRTPITIKVPPISKEKLKSLKLTGHKKELQKEYLAEMTRNYNLKVDGWEAKNALLSKKIAALFDSFDAEEWIERHVIDVD